MGKIVALAFITLVAGVVAEPPVGYLPPARRNGGGSPASTYGAPFGGSQNGGKTFHSQRSGSNSFAYDAHHETQSSGTSFGSSGFGVGQQYGAPARDSSSSSGSSFGVSQQYGAPAAGASGSSGFFKSGHGSSSGAGGFGVAQQYGAPSAGASGSFNSGFASSSGASFGSKSGFGASRPYSAPSSGFSQSSFGGRSSGHSFGAAGAGSGAASGSGFGVSQQYGAPSSGSFRAGGALAPVYGVPKAAAYTGVDEQSEPPSYEYTYEVEAADVSGVLFGHKESREDESARGSYHVLLPDGRTQIVEYQADEDGFHPKIRYEGVANTGSAGTRGTGLQGPY